MQATIQIQIGKTPITITFDAETPADLIRKTAFWQSLPATGPNGETDLRLQHRLTKDDHEYFSLVCPSAGLEFRLGQSKKVKGDLFPKGWHQLLHGVEQSDQDSEGTSSVATIEELRVLIRNLGGTTKATALAIIADAMEWREGKMLEDLSERERGKLYGELMRAKSDRSRKR